MIYLCVSPPVKESLLLLAANSTAAIIKNVHSLPFHCARRSRGDGWMEGRRRACTDKLDIGGEGVKRRDYPIFLNFILTNAPQRTQFVLAALRT